MYRHMSTQIQYTKRMTRFHSTNSSKREEGRVVTSLASAFKF